jgi:hypothetical protein
MGRPSKGAWTVYEAIRLELPWLLNTGHIKKGAIVCGHMTWTNNQGREIAAMTFESCYTATEKHFRVLYSIKQGNDTKNYDYKIQLTEVKSNLGKGSVLYFLCPFTYSRCRILYLAYGSHQFLSRIGYERVHGKRLYYVCQHSSKLWKYCDNYWKIDKLLKAMAKQAGQGRRTYRSKLTKRAIRYNRQSLRQTKMDHLRFTAGVPKSLRGKVQI